jgi:hypothetical protein
MFGRCVFLPRSSGEALKSDATRSAPSLPTAPLREPAVRVETPRDRIVPDCDQSQSIRLRNFLLQEVMGSRVVPKRLACGCSEGACLYGARCGIVRHRRCPQSPLAALNAFGLFAAGASRRARPHACRRWRPPACRRRSPLCSTVICPRHVEKIGADNGTSLDGVLWSWTSTPRLRARRYLDRTCVAPRSMGCFTAWCASTSRLSSGSSSVVTNSEALLCS